MKIVLISDTHEKHNQVSVPEGDVLIHAGDLTKTGSLVAVATTAVWLNDLDFKHKIVIAGNHDFCFASSFRSQAVGLLSQFNINYLEDSEIVLDGIKFYGSPWQPEFHNWAFNLPRGKPLEQKWSQIPDDTNVLITHGPPYGILDLVEDNFDNSGRDLHQGCLDLTKRIFNLKQLKAHIFGHLHLNGGKMRIINNTLFANGAICTDKNAPTNPPIVFEI